VKSASLFLAKVKSVSLSPRKVKLDSLFAALVGGAV